ncbi:MAG: hypothetical protein GY850_00420 [bacterium]|nr:hypothetical protein [bacterium]
MDESGRESHWTESIASGSKSFIEEVKKSLGFKVKSRSITDRKGHYQLREDVSKFGNASKKAKTIKKTETGILHGI